MVVAEFPKQVAQSFGANFHAVDDFTQVINCDLLWVISYSLEFNSDHSTGWVIRHGPARVNKLPALLMPTFRLFQNVLQFVLLCFVQFFSFVKLEEKLSSRIEATKLVNSPDRRVIIVFVDEVRQGIKYFLLYIAVRCCEATELCKDGIELRLADEFFKARVPFRRKLSAPV
jgi:hypothetical protein